jgi:GDP-L-fucose synthase
MIRRFHDAMVAGDPTVTCWGTGTPKRELLHVDDMASACLHLLEHYDDPQTINVGTGEDVSIRELAELVAAVVGFSGEIAWDTSKPDGTPRKLLDVSRLTELGWKAEIGLEEGIRRTYGWFLDNVEDIRR